MINDRIRLGISSCLMGNNVRYDGGHKLDYFLKDTLSRYVEWLPVCPEVEIGLPVPREAMRLVGSADEPRLVTIESVADYTDRMNEWTSRRCEELAAEDLCGFVFKSRSPSCAMRGVKVDGGADMMLSDAAGLFAAAFMRRFPLLPVEDEEGLISSPGARKDFIKRIFAVGRSSGDVSRGPMRN